METLKKDVLAEIFMTNRYIIARMVKNSNYNLELQNKYTEENKYTCVELNNKYNETKDISYRQNMICNFLSFLKDSLKFYLLLSKNEFLDNRFSINSSVNEMNEELIKKYINEDVLDEFEKIKLDELMNDGNKTVAYHKLLTVITLNKYIDFFIDQNIFDIVKCKKFYEDIKTINSLDLLNNQNIDDSMMNEFLQIYHDVIKFLSYNICAYCDRIEKKKTFFKKQ